MPEHRYLVITLRKEVASEEEAISLTGIVKQKLAEHPDIIITAKQTQNIGDPDP